MGGRGREGAKDRRTHSVIEEEAGGGEGGNGGREDG